MKKTANKDIEKSIYDIDTCDVVGTLLGVGLIFLMVISLIAIGVGFFFLIGLFSK